MLPASDITAAKLPSQRGTIRRGQAPWTGSAISGSRRFWVRLLPCLVVLAVLTHLPSFLRTVWNPDEGFLATQARLLAHGSVLYETVVDRKPPLLPWLYEGLLGVFGYGSLWPLRAAALLAHLVTAALLASTARHRWGDRAGVAAGVGYLLVSIGLAPADTQAATFEVFMLPWTAAAFWCADRGRWTCAGLAAAGAALTKQTGAAMLLPLAWMAWHAARSAGAAGSSRPSRAWTRLALGFLLPVAMVAAALGAARFLFWTVTGSGSYLSASGAWLIVAGRALGNTGILLTSCAGLAVPPAWSVARRRLPGDADLWIWLAASALAVVTGFQFYGHYFLQLLPPLVLLGVAALRRLPRWRRPAAAWTALAACGFLLWGLSVPRTELNHSKAVAAAIGHRTAPGERVLIWGMHPEEYWLADRIPASRYLTAGFLTNFSGGRGGARVGEQYAVPGAWQAFRREMAQHPPALIVDDSRGAPYGPQHVRAFKELLETHYRPVGSTGGAVLYVRR
ncbi:MAG: glycosyltransferase family 39 protein [Streptomycetaceae bacterium]|nr:glycosyltransferase family 39 protein [Streptomycetaceae bacterium]